MNLKDAQMFVVMVWAVLPGEIIQDLGDSNVLATNQDEALTKGINDARKSHESRYGKLSPDARFFATLRTAYKGKVTDGKA